MENEALPEPGGLPTGSSDRELDDILAAAHRRLGSAVNERLTAQGGPPEVRDPDRTLDRLLSATHRQVGRAVSRRTHTWSHEDGPNGSPAGRHEASWKPADRPAATRLKHRRETLRILESFGQWDPATELKRALIGLEDLSDLIVLKHFHRASNAFIDVVTALEGVLCILPRIRSSPPLDGGYQHAVLEHVRSPVTRLASKITSIHRFTHGELGPRILSTSSLDHDARGSALEMIQDMCDDVRRALDFTPAVEDAIAEVRRACDDFCGFDLHSMDLEEIPLEGVRWSRDTIWPADWEARIRRSSLPANGSDTELVVVAEPSDREVPVGV